jgi:hypothetical protein
LHAHRQSAFELLAALGWVILYMPTSTSILLAKAITVGLDEAERSMVAPQLLAQLAIGGHITLTPTDRRRLPKTILALLATGGFIELTRYERDSFNQHTLALLAIGGRTTLQATEFIRLPPDLQSVVKRSTARLAKEGRTWQNAKIEADVEIDHGLASLPFTISVSS